MKLVLNRLLLFLVAMKGTAKNEEQKLFFSQKQFDFGCSLTSEVISNIVMTEDANWLPIPLVNGRQSGKLAVTFKLLRTRLYLYFLYSILDLVSVFKKLNPRHDVITCRAHPVMTSLLKRTYWTYCCCCCCFHRMCQGFPQSYLISKYTGVSLYGLRITRSTSLYGLAWVHITRPSPTSLYGLTKKL